MFSVRALTRSIPKSLFRPSVALRPLSNAARPSFFQSTWKPAVRPTYSAFSTSVPRREQAGESDPELSAKIEQELSLEKKAKNPTQYPAAVQEFIDTGSFEVSDVPGTEEVILTKNFGDETVKVVFSIADLNDFEEEADQLDEDGALEDEADDFGNEVQPQRTRGTINQRGSSVNMAPEDSLSPSDRTELAGEEAGAAEDEVGPGFATHLTVTISKPGKGAIQATVVAQDGVVDVEDVSFFPKSDMAEARSAEKLYARERVYAGPPFANLDSDLQDMLVRYLDERGINTQLALFVPEYIDYKEQREYVQWLENMKSFIDA